MAIVYGLGQMPDQGAASEAVVLEGGDFLDAANAEIALKKLGFFPGPLEDLLTVPEWDFETRRAFEAWAKASGIEYELTADPAPIYEDRPNAYVVVTPAGVTNKLFQDAEKVSGEPTTMSVATRDPETGRLTFEAQEVKASTGGLPVIILAGVGVAALAWFFAETRSVVSGLHGYRRRQNYLRSNRYRRRARSFRYAR